MIKQIEISIKFHKTSLLVKELYGGEYYKSVQPYIEIIKLVQEKQNLDTLRAFLFISETELFKENPKIQLLFVSAAHDIISSKTMS